MKSVKSIVLLLAVVFVAASCRDSLGMNTPVGNYLSLNLSFPDEGTSADSSRVLHSSADEIVVTLTYSGKEPVEYHYDRSSESTMNILIDKLSLGTGVKLEVSSGLKDENISLTSGSTTIDLKAGGNSAIINMVYLDYTINGTLYDTDGVTPVPGQPIDINGKTVTTDANGKYTFTINTESMDYIKFNVNIGGGDAIYDFVRKPPELIKDRTNFSLALKRELFVDFIVKSQQFPLAGAKVNITNLTSQDTSKKTTLTSDSNGRVYYQDRDYGESSSSYSISISKNLFIDPNSSVPSAGGLIDDVTLEPYVIFLTENYSIGGYVIEAVDFSNGVLTPLEASSIVSSVDASATFNSSYNTNGGKVYCDYKNGYIYFFCSADGSSTSGKLIIKLDGFSNKVLNTIDLGTEFSDIYNSGYPFSVQQMYPVDGGSKILVTTTLGAFTFDPSKMAIVDRWVSPNFPSTNILLNGGYESSDGSLYVMGEEVNASSGTPVNGVQKIYKLTAGGSMTFSNNLPDTYNVLNNSDFSGGSYFNSMIGLFPWSNGSVLSVKTQTTSSYSFGGGGVIVPLKNWNLLGSPLNNSYDYLVPVGVLPDNKFYIVNETISSGGKKKILRMSSPTDTSTESYIFMTNPSTMNTSMFYYFNPSYFNTSNPY